MPANRFNNFTNSYTVVGEVVESIRGHVRLRPLQREKIEHFNLPLPQENVVRSRSGRRGLIVTHFLSIGPATTLALADRKSTRLNSSHGYISYAVFCLQK